VDACRKRRREKAKDRKQRVVCYYCIPSAHYLLTDQTLITTPQPLSIDTSSSHSESVKENVALC
jgi:hypothetical protein